MNYNSSNFRCIDINCRKSQSIRTNTFCDSMKFEIRKVLQFLYFFIIRLG